jgi:LuxR family maltose regulon positive regulatory protein
MVGASALTRAELRLLPLLATHLTFREIGERLYISQNTAKRQAVFIHASSASPPAARRSSAPGTSACSASSLAWTLAAKLAAIDGT